MIEPVANITCGLFITGEKDVLLDWNKTEKAQEIMDEEQNNMSVGQINGLYTEKQMQEYAEAVQEQLNTAKYFFKNILDVNPNLKKGSYAHLSNCVNVMKNSAEKALAAIGGDDE